MAINRPIIVSMTSWKKRIQYVSRSIFQMHTQTIKPLKIYLTLSMDEFPNKEQDLPQDLILLHNVLPEFTIKWVKENTKAFKKLIPVLHEHINDNVWILTIDDDVFYAKNYIEFIVTQAELHFGSVINPRMAGNWLHGAFGCYHPLYFKDKSIFKITPCEMIEFIEDDKWYSACYHRNNIKDILIPELKQFYKMSNLPNPLSQSYFSLKNNQKVKKLTAIILNRS